MEHLKQMVTLLRVLGDGPLTGSVSQGEAQHSPAHAGPLTPASDLNLLTERLIRFERRDGSVSVGTLPDVMGLLVQDEITVFPALRPHQRHAWHAFLVQLGSIALLSARLQTPPDDAQVWASLLARLTPGHEATAWSLIALADRPGFMQPGLPGRGLAELEKRAVTPDMLDMLVTSRNHDVKMGVMADAQADDWMFALITLQTMEGIAGKKNYGISRLADGYSNRPAVSVAPSGGPGRHVRRDIVHLLALGGSLTRSPSSHSTTALALMWLMPWDGFTPLSWSSLHPLYIEVCRRVRLVSEDGKIVAWRGLSEAARVAGVPAGGVTGDPWTPIQSDNGISKALRVGKAGFSYRPLMKLLFPTDGEPAPLQAITPADDAEGLVVLARALVRGQGKTEGLFERRVPISRKQPMGLRSGSTDPGATMAHERERQAAEMAASLRFALFALFQNGPAEINVRHDPTGRKAKPFLDAFERAVDQTFFDALYDEAETEPAEARHAIRSAWVKGLLAMARTILDQADGAAARATNRRYRARVRAHSVLNRTACNKPLLAAHLETAREP